VNIGYLDGHAGWVNSEHLLVLEKEGEIEGLGSWGPTTQCCYGVECGAFDEVWMLVRPMASPSMMMVHYYMDEEDQVLVREMASPWARTGVEPVVWRMGHILSFEVEALDEEGKWQDVWDAGESRKLPLALRVRLKGDQGEREFLLPVFTQAGV